MIFKKPKIVDEWDKLEKPLIDLDMELKLVCKQNSMNLDSNYHDWPSRSLTWVVEDLQRQIEISLEPSMESFQIIGYVLKDEGGWRFIKIVKLKEKLSPPLSNVVVPEMNKWIRLINSIQRNDLSKSTKLK